jgi:hypothetical protein
MSLTKIKIYIHHKHNAKQHCSWDHRKGKLSFQCYYIVWEFDCSQDGSWELCKNMLVSKVPFWNPAELHAALGE